MSLLHKHSVEYINTDLTEDEGPENEVDEEVSFSQDERHSRNEGCLSVIGSWLVLLKALTQRTRDERQNGYLRKICEEEESSENDERSDATFEQRRQDGCHQRGVCTSVFLPTTTSNGDTNE